MYGVWTRTLDPNVGLHWQRVLVDTVNWAGHLLASASRPRVTFVTDGVLGLLPLHAAPASPGATVLDHATVRYAPTGSRLRATGVAAGPAAPGRAVFALADDVPWHEPLLFARLEVAAAASTGIWASATVLEGEAATPAAVEAALGDCEPLHLACHGRTRFDDPRESFLVLHGGDLLTLGRILDVRLPRAPLVVLSACETGMTEVGVPEEKNSLAHGLLLAGASGVVASLWAVDDLSTMLLMSRFHALIGDGVEASSALRHRSCGCATRQLRCSARGAPSGLVSWRSPARRPASRTRWRALLTQFPRPTSRSPTPSTGPASPTSVPEHCSSTGTS